MASSIATARAGLNDGFSGVSAAPMLDGAFTSAGASGAFDVAGRSRERAGAIRATIGCKGSWGPAGAARAES